ncbi:MAG: beta-ketoacyl synthase chain length factor [Polaromonas sp.]|uniref:beta-ketoacyl synthase chain length factor n=1 Tax=Polaromonas sp. TaxID=1869339 RepID=UPI00179B3C09|nr:beta-ketoacyl synthase chain length factor [Polaromonas sp.]MBA3594946.1 beta-ketoacyl synthase chain length factor [Polaromonas sp.]
MTANNTSALTVFVEGIGLVGPGLSNWEDGRDKLRGQSPYVSAATVLQSPMSLPAAERRRAGAVIKVSLAVGHEAVNAAGMQAADLPSVFTSSSGDGVNCHDICSTLASSDRLISPTRFHNSVHNAASGYWSISTGATPTSSVLCAHDGSFSAGLLEAIAQATVDNTAVLLVAYDTHYPEPLYSKRPVSDTLGVALVLSPQRSERSLARLTLSAADCLTDAPVDVLTDPALEFLRHTIPAARALPLLQRIAVQQTTTVVLDYLDAMRLAVDVARP